jgi:hypothetical protein
LPADVLHHMAFFLYRDGHEIRRAKGDYEIASYLHGEGYELFSRPLFTDQEAVTEERAWQERVDKMREQGSDPLNNGLCFGDRTAH